jgi:malate dehydrogenase
VQLSRENITSVTKKSVKILITGAAGQIAYSLIFQLIHRASYTDLFDGKVLELYLLDLESKAQALNGVKMEIDDCAFEKLASLVCSTNIDEVAQVDLDYALLVGAFPRGKGMQRADLLDKNGQIFQEQGRALDRCPNVKVLVVGNPCNTNALVFYHNTKNIPSMNIRAMMRLDQNRAVHQMAKALGKNVGDVNNMVVWGNHSTSMVPDFTKIEGSSKKIVENRPFFEGEYLTTIQKRGAHIIASRGASSAASAAKAIIDSLADWQGKTKGSYSAAIYSKDNPYNIDPDLFFSFAMQGQSIVEGVAFDPFIQAKIIASEKELVAERDAVRHHFL